MIEEYKWIFPNLFLNWCRRTVICNLKLTRVVRTSKDQGRWSFEVVAQTRTTTATKNTRSFQNKHQRSTQRPRKCLECPKTIPLHLSQREANHKVPHHHSHHHHRNNCIGNRRKLRNKKNRKNRRRKRNRRKRGGIRRKGRIKKRRRIRRRRRRRIKRRRKRRRRRRRKGKDIGVRAPVRKKGGDDCDDFLYQCSFG